LRPWKKGEARKDGWTKNKDPEYFKPRRMIFVLVPERMRNPTLDQPVEIAETWFLHFSMTF
jgi:hypothetical protein